ncbi:Serine/threonine protein kinase [hydrothermal vent metagenome]|uniref:Serine/threonine protein kinase n=1 Tax=hydrothermal vent metagenome TaxID=652676 RepID=A0A3B0ZI99_9ZZZZ
MSLLKNYKANKAIDILLESDPGSAQAKEAINKIKNIGESSVGNLIDAIPEAGSIHVIETLLVSFLNNRSLNLYIEALTDTDNRIVKKVMTILASHNTYDINKLLNFIEDPDIPKNVLVHILIAQKKQLNPILVARLIANSDKGGRQVLFRIMDEISNESAVDELSKLSYHKDASIRQIALRLLSRIDTTQVRDIFYRCIPDSERMVRVAALDGLLKLTVHIDSKLIVEYLKDRDLATQSKAIELLIYIKDPETVTYLIEILQDDSEFVRRAAVEVLNEISDERSIKSLISTLRDKDWWVRVRAADALGSIGGPNVVNAIFSLMSDKDEFLRRTAVEILNCIKDDRALSHLIKALGDDDWWVKERAADALAQLGDERAVDALLELLSHDNDSRKIAIKTLLKIVGKEKTQALIIAKNDLNDSIKNEIINAISNLESVSLEIDISNSNQNSRTLNTRTDNSIIQQDTKVNTKIQSDIQPVSEANEPATVRNVVTEEIINPAKLVADQIIGERYKVLKQIGKGAFGTVVLVEDTIVDEEIILKFLNPQVASDENMIRRFIHELRYARKVTHENVIRIYDFLRLGNSNAISMEYFHSHSLSYEIKNKMTSDRLRMVNILLDICHGMSFAHRAKVVHRDLKPANILVDDNDIVKIVDFGLAAAASQTDSRITKSGILVGTPTYMAPEQVRDKEIDARTDIYSLGVLMYELFTGRPPYKGKDSMAILFQHVEGKAKKPKELVEDLPDALDAIIMKALKVDPEKRYQTVDELRSHLAKCAVILQEAS